MDNYREYENIILCDTDKPYSEIAAELKALKFSDNEITMALMQRSIVRGLTIPTINVQATSHLISKIRAYNESEAIQKAKSKGIKISTLIGGTSPITDIINFRSEDN